MTSPAWREDSGPMESVAINMRTLGWVSLPAAKADAIVGS
jgi:hypothetical protein